MTQINLSKHRFLLCGRPKNLMRIFECWRELQIPPPKARWQCFIKFYHSRKEFQPYNQFGLDWLLLIGSLWSRLLMSKHLLNFFTLVHRHHSVSSVCRLNAQRCATRQGQGARAPPPNRRTAATATYQEKRPTPLKVTLDSVIRSAEPVSDTRFHLLITISTTHRITQIGEQKFETIPPYMPRFGLIGN